MLTGVVPDLNTSEAVANTVRVRKVLSTATAEPPEIVVVDDGSTDSARALEKKAGAAVTRRSHI